MATATLNTASLRRRVGLGLLRRLSASWQAYRRSRYLLQSSYEQHPMARGIPRRVWGRHSALFEVMPDPVDRAE